MFETIRELTNRGNADVEEALDRQADALLADDDDDAALLATYDDDSKTLVPLFGLARKLKETLAPIEPADSFISTLRAELSRAANEQADAIAPSGQGRRVTWRSAGLVGLSVAMIVITIRIGLGMLQKRKATTA